MLEAWRSIRLQATELGRQLVAKARQSHGRRLLMSIPGVGAITATSFVTRPSKAQTTSDVPARSVPGWV